MPIVIVRSMLPALCQLCFPKTYITHYQAATRSKCWCKPPTSGCVLRFQRAGSCTDRDSGLSSPATDADASDDYLSLDLELESTPAISGI